MTNDDLNNMLCDKLPNVSRQNDTKWTYSLTESIALTMSHSEDKQDLQFIAILEKDVAHENKQFYVAFLQFTPTLPNGAFAIDDNHNLVFVDRIPTFDLDWRELQRTIETARVISCQINRYLNQARAEQ